MNNHERFVELLSNRVQRGVMTEAQMLDLLIQKGHFDTQRRYIETRFQKLFVGFVDGVIHIEQSFQGIISHASHGKLVYFEPVGFTM
jgi:hypothetical protein